MKLKKEGDEVPPSDEELFCQTMVKALMLGEAEFRAKVLARLQAGKPEADEAEQRVREGLNRQWSKALEDVRKVLAANPGRADNHLSLGTCLFGLGHYAEAEVAYAEALRLEPGAPDVEQLLEMVRQERRRSMRGAGEGP